MDICHPHNLNKPLDAPKPYGIRVSMRSTDTFARLLGSELAAASIGTRRARSATPRWPTWPASISTRAAATSRRSKFEPIEQQT